MKKRMIALDADPLIYQATESKKDTMNYFGKETEGENLSEKSYKKPLKPFKRRFKQLVKDIEDEVAASLPGIVKGIVPIFSDPVSNFRYDIYPEYKNKRTNPKSKEYYRLRKWLLKKYGYVKHVEADDVVAYYVREKKYIGASLDKDLLKGVEGVWFNTHYMKRTSHTTDAVDAYTFTLQQTLAGDNVDSIPGIPRVGMKTANNLLTSNGCSWEGVEQSYINAGLTKEDALLNRRLIGMDQFDGKKITLWRP